MKNKVFKFNYSAIPLFLAFVAAILYSCILDPVIVENGAYVTLTRAPEHLFSLFYLGLFFIFSFFILGSGVLSCFTTKVCKIINLVLFGAFAGLEMYFLGEAFMYTVSSQSFYYALSIISSLLGIAVIVYVFVASILNLKKGFLMKLWFLPLILCGAKIIVDVVTIIIADPVFEMELSINQYFKSIILCLVSIGVALICLNYIQAKEENVEEENVEQVQEKVETPVQEKKKTQAQPIEEPVTQKRKTQAYEVPNTEDITITPQQRRRTQAYDIPQEDYQPQIKKRTQAYDIPTVDATQTTGRRTQAQPIEPQVKPRSTRAVDINQTQYQQTQTQSQNIRGRRTQGMNVPPFEPQQGNYNSMENVHRDLSRLKRMLDNGLITQEDYDRLKSQIFKG